MDTTGAGPAGPAREPIEDPKEPAPRSTGRTGRVNRSKTEVRARLLRSARELFGEQGFSGATTRRIAERAGVAESLLFRHFGSKDALFEAAVFEPLQLEFENLLVRWKQYGQNPDDNPIQSARSYVDSLYAVLLENRSLLMSVMTAQEHDILGEVGGRRRDSMLSELLDEIEKATREGADKRGWAYADFPIAVRLCFAMALSITMFDGWLLPQGMKHPSEKRIKDEMAAFMVHGLGHRDVVSPDGD